MPRTRPLFALLLAAVTVLAGACGGGGGDDSAGRTGGEGCPEEASVRATFLPSGFDKEIKEGAGGGKDAPEKAVAHHWEGSNENTYIDVFRGGVRNKIVKGAKIEMFDRVARYKKIAGGGFGAKVKVARSRCARYQVEAFGISEGDFKKVVNGLERILPGTGSED